VRKDNPRTVLSTMQGKEARCYHGFSECEREDLEWKKRLPVCPVTRSLPVAELYMFGNLNSSEEKRPKEFKNRFRSLVDEAERTAQMKSLAYSRTRPRPKKREGPRKETEQEGTLSRPQKYLRSYEGRGATWTTGEGKNSTRNLGGPTSHREKIDQRGGLSKKSQGLQVGGR